MSEPLLQLDRLTKRYGALVAVDNVTMRVREGEVRAVIGPNGAGKTTLFHLITGVVAPSSGTVRFRDSELTRLAPHATSATPAWLWSADGSRVLWCNAAAAAVFNAPTPSTLAERRFEPGHPVAEQIGRLAETLSEGGIPRLERLRGFGG